MIEKITLNNAIINEDIVSAILGALPQASDNNKGLINASKYRALPRLIIFEVKFSMYKICTIDRDWQSRSILIFGALDNKNRAALYTFFSNSLTDESIVENSTKNIFAGSMDYLAFYIKDGAIYIRNEEGAWNGGIFILGDVNSFLSMGVVTDVSGFKKMNI